MSGVALGTAAIGAAGSAASGGKGDEGGGGAPGAASVYDPFARNRQMYMDKLNAFMKDPSSIYESPAYKARTKAGLHAVESKGAAQGLLDSGQIGIELMTAGQDMATQEYDKEFERLSKLAGAGIGPMSVAGGQPQSNPWADAAGFVGGVAGQLPWDDWFGGGTTSPVTNPNTYGGATPTNDMFGPRDSWT